MSITNYLTQLLAVCLLAIFYLATLIPAPQTVITISVPTPPTPVSTIDVSNTIPTSPQIPRILRERLVQLITDKGTDKPLFELILRQAFRTTTLLPHSMDRRVVIIVIPKVPKGKYLHLRRMRIRVRDGVEGQPSMEERDEELRALQEYQIFYFASYALSDWITECGGKVRQVLKADAPLLIYNKALEPLPFLDNSLPPSLILLPGAEALLNRLEVDLRARTVEQSLETVLRIMRGEEEYSGV